MKSVIHVLKVVFLAVVLSFGISYVYAWVAPTNTPPGGNVAAPINIGSVTQTKIGGDICVNIGGVTKCLGSASVAPTITLSVAASTVVNGGSTTISWSTTNATSCTASGDWSGSKTTAPSSQSTGALAGAANYTYTLTCTGAGSTSSSQSVSVFAQAPPPPPPPPSAPSISISASLSTVANGGLSNITWSTANATSCTASNAWSGAKSVSGGTQSTGALAGAANYTYTLTCTGAGGTANQSVSVFAQAPAAPTAILTANGSTSLTVNVGDTATYAWSSTGGTSWSSTYSATGCANPASNTPTTPWFISTASGTGSGVVVADQAGCNYVLKYTVSGPGGSTTATVNASVAGIPHGSQTFTSNGSFTVPAAVTSLVIDVVGGGGGGGGGLWCPGDCHTSSGGGSGGYVHTTVAVTPGQVIPVVVGNGGAGGTGGVCWAAGGAGSASSFGVVSSGGGGGGNWPSGGAPGTPGGASGSGGSWYTNTSHGGGSNGSGAGTGGTGFGCFTSGTAGQKGKVVVTW